MKPEVSIIYTCHNCTDKLLDSLKTISSGSGKVLYEIIVIDNESKKAIKLQRKQPNIKIIRNRENIGFWSALDQGALLARGEYLLLANTDILFAPKSIEKMVIRIKSDGKIGIVAPQILGPDNIIISVRSELSMLPRNKFFSRYKMPDVNSTKEQFVDIVDGVCILIPKHLFEKVKGFDKRLFLFFKKRDLCIKVRKAGYKNLYYPDSKILHFGARSFQKNARSYP